MLERYLTGYAQYCELGQWAGGNRSAATYIVPLCTEAQHFSWAQLHPAP
jgi:hypothetical protein